MTIDAVLLDKDGTFVDFAATWGPAIESVMREMAPDATVFRRLAEINRYDPATGRLDASSPFIHQASADFARGWAEVLDVPMDDAFHRRLDRLLDAAALAHVTPLAGSAAVFTRLRALGLKLAVVTNDTEAGARAQCIALGLAPLIDAIVGYDSGHGRKPAPGQILACCDRLALRPERCLMVGDARSDLTAGRAAGAVTVGVLSGYAARDDLAPHADHVLPDIAALPDLVGRLRGSDRQ
jgi:phosphoglycolate phosphatase